MLRFIFKRLLCYGQDLVSPDPTSRPLHSWSEWEPCIWCLLCIIMLTFNVQSAKLLQLGRKKRRQTQQQVTWRYFTSSGSFQDVRGKLIVVVQDHPVQSPPSVFISNLYVECFGFPWLSTKWKSQNKKNSMWKTINNQQPTKCAVNLHQVCDVIHNALRVKQQIFLI